MQVLVQILNSHTNYQYYKNNRGAVTTSFMMIEGKMCVCNKCNATTLANYERGPQFTQISDGEVWRQEQLAEKYGTIDDPILSKFYIVEGGLCQHCFESLDVESAILDKWKSAWEIEKQIAEQNRINSLFWQQVNELSGEIMEVWLKEVSLQQVDSDAYEKILSDGNIREKGRIKSLINEYLRRNRAAIILLLEEEFKEEPGFINIEDEYNKKLMPSKQELERLLKSIPMEDFDYFCNVNLAGRVENLNPIIEAYTTIRTVAEDKDCAYYVCSNFSPREIRIIDELILPPNWSAYLNAKYAEYIEKSLRQPFAAQVRDGVFK